jgi:hypothetical protein
MKTPRHEFSRFAWGWFGALLLLAVVVRYPGVVLGDETFVFRDFGFFGHPLACYFKECFLNGEVPLWNPLSNCGLPFAAQWNTMVFYPPCLLYLLLPLDRALSWFCLLHLVWAGLGMHRLARQWTGNSFAACFAGIAYAFNGFTVNSLMWPNYMAVISWTPWVIWSVQKAVHRGQSSLFLAGCAGVMQMLGGNPEWTFLTWVFTTGLVCVESNLQNAGPRLYRFLIILVWVAGLSAIQLLPFLRFLPDTARSADFGGMEWAMPSTGWVNFIVPLFGCYRSSVGVYFQNGQLLTSSYYVGAIVLLLVIIAPACLKNRTSLYLGGASLVSIILALGDSGYVLPWIKKLIPQIGYARFPIKFLAISLFSLPLLAALMVHRLSVTSKKVRAKATFAIVFPGILLAILTLGIIGYAMHHPLAGKTDPMITQNGITRLAFLGGAIALLVTLVRNPASNLRETLQLGLLTVLFVDLTTHVPEQNPTARRAMLRPGQVVFDQPIVYGKARAMVSKEADAILKGIRLPNADEDYLWHRLGLYGDCNLIDLVPKLGGAYALLLAQPTELLRDFYGNKEPLDLPLADFLGAAVHSSGTNPVQWINRKNFLPLVTAGQAPEFAEQADSKAIVNRRNFDPRSSVILPLDARDHINVRNAEPAVLRNLTYGYHRITGDIETQRGTMLVIAQAYYPCWKAFVDGRERKLWKANYAFQAVEIPAGHVRIEMNYQDRQFQLGSVISLAILAAGIWGWRLSQKSNRCLPVTHKA